MRFLTPTEYLPRVHEIYDGLSARLLTAIPFADIQHIGSSAIAGALSKGDLDVLVRVPPDHFAEALRACEALGFREKVGTRRTESLCMLITDGYRWDVAVQLVAMGSEFEMFLTFRDRLNADPSLVEQYNELKLSCAGLTPNDYRKRKSEFVERVLRNEKG